MHVILTSQTNFFWQIIIFVVINNLNNFLPLLIFKVWQQNKAMLYLHFGHSYLPMAWVPKRCGTQGYSRCYIWYHVNKICLKLMKLTIRTNTDQNAICFISLRFNKSVLLFQFTNDVWENDTWSKTKNFMFTNFH